MDNINPVPDWMKDSVPAGTNITQGQPGQYVPPTSVSPTATPGDTSVPEWMRNSVPTGVQKENYNYPDIGTLNKPEPSTMDIVKGFGRGLKKVTVGLSPEEEEYEQRLPPTGKEATAESAGSGAAFGAPFGPAGAIAGAAGSGTTEGLNQAWPGHPILSTGAGLIAGAVAGPVISNITEFAFKGARSIPEQVGLFQSPVNRLYSDIGNPRRAAGMEGSWPSLMQMQNALREGLGGSGAIRGSEQAVFSAVEQRANQIANRLGPDMTQQELGEHIIGTAMQRADQIKTEINSMYTALNNIVPRQTQLFPTNFYRNLLDLNKRYAGAPELQQVFGNSAPRTLLALQNDLLNSPNLQLNYSVLQNIRTDIGESIAKATLNPNANIKELRGMYRALTSDMESAYTNTNNLHGLRAFQTVNAAAERQFDTLEQVLQPYAKAGLEPELVTQRLLAASNKGSTRIDNIVTQLQSIDPGVRSTVMGYVLRNLGEMKDGSFNPVRFYTNWQALSPEAKALYPAAQREGIENLAKLSGIVKESYSAFNASHTSGNLDILQRIGHSVRGLTRAGMMGVGWTGAHLTGNDTNLGVGAGYALGETAAATLGESMINNALAKLWTNKQFNIWLGTQAPNLTPDKLLTSLGALAGQAPEISDGLQYLSHQLSKPEIGPIGKDKPKQQFMGGGYADPAPNNPNGYAGGGPAAQWMNMSEGYAEGGSVINQEKAKDDLLSMIMRYNLTNTPLDATEQRIKDDAEKGKKTSPQPQGMAMGGEVAAPWPTSGGLMEYADGGMSDNMMNNGWLAPSLGANDNQTPGFPGLESGHRAIPMALPNIVPEGSIVDMVFPINDNKWGAYAQGGITHNIDDPRPSYNPQLPRVNGGGWTNGGPVSNSEIGGYASGGSIESNIIKSESSGNPNAKNPRSSASGLGQFIDPTWINMMKKYHPEIADPMSVKNDPNLQREMITNYANENMDYLKSKGVQSTPGNVYLAHFLGPAGAVAFNKSDPNASAASVIGAYSKIANKILEANPFLKNMTVAQVMQLMAKKMGGSTMLASSAKTPTDTTPNETPGTTNNEVPKETEPEIAMLEPEQSDAVIDMLLKNSPEELHDAIKTIASSVNIKTSGDNNGSA